MLAKWITRGVELSWEAEDKIRVMNEIKHDVEAKPN